MSLQIIGTPDLYIPGQGIVTPEDIERYKKEYEFRERILHLVKGQFLPFQPLQLSDSAGQELFFQAPAADGALTVVAKATPGQLTWDGDATFSSQDMGSNTGSKVVVVTAGRGHSLNVGGPTITDIKIAGTSGSVLSTIEQRDGTAGARCAIWAREVTSTTSGDVQVIGNVLGAAFDDVQICVYEVLGADQTSFPTSFEHATDSTDINDTLAGTINVAEGGARICAGWSHDTSAWVDDNSQFTEDVEGILGSYSEVDLSVETGRAWSITPNSTAKSQAGCCISIEPA